MSHQRKSSDSMQLLHLDGLHVGVIKDVRPNNIYGINWDNDDNELKWTEDISRSNRLVSLNVTMLIAVSRVIDGLSLIYSLAGLAKASDDKTKVRFDYSDYYQWTIDGIIAIRLP